MITISAKQVMDLRAATGMPMMQCKKALEAEGGDFEKAFDRLRKEGLKTAEKRADRATSEGVVRAHIEDDHATMIAVGCETEPVSNLPMFKEFADRVLEQVEAKNPADVEALLKQSWIDDDAQTVEDGLRNLIAQIKENIKVSSINRLDKDGDGTKIGAYVHHDGKQGAMVLLETTKDDPDLDNIARGLCMHIVFSKPTALSRDEIPADVREKEMEIYRAQIAEDPKMAKKPAQVIDKIVDGKMGAFFQQSVLSEQEWSGPDSHETVGKVLEKHGASVKTFRRVHLGS